MLLLNCQKLLASINISISNSDDHLRNHGFLLTDEGWRLSPAYGVNPSIDKQGLALNIDMDSNALDFDLARSVGEFFMLDQNSMNKIISEIMAASVPTKAGVIPEGTKDGVNSTFTLPGGDKYKETLWRTLLGPRLTKEFTLVRNDVLQKMRVLYLGKLFV